MQEQRINALIVPRADEYLGEYLPPYNERLRWLTGFTGSAGVAVVCADRAALFVDGRYTEQVHQQVSAELFEFKHLVDDPFLDWINAELGDKARVAYDPRLHTLTWQRKAEKTLGDNGKQLVALEQNLVDLCWRDRPVPEVRLARLLADHFTGKPSSEKRREIGEAVAAAGADLALIFASDSVAWLLNIRGQDIPALPLVLGCALLSADGSMQFFTDSRKIPAAIGEHVGAGVSVRNEAELGAALAGLDGQRVLADPETANAWTLQALCAAGAHLIEGPDPVLIPKACKNPTEIAGMRAAHVRDATAEIGFLCWLDGEVTAGRFHDEAVLADKLFQFRAEQELFQELSFDTISAAAANGSIVHYDHRNATPRILEKNSTYLVDSGGQYLDGTTDITRTIAIGSPGDEVRRRFTLVLKGHIALDRARFPFGTTGSQLDVLARQFLWENGLDYDHGTGHGVGCYLSVHEGPQRISKLPNTIKLLPGMVVSNEPGYYRAGCYGIRCENLLLVKTVPQRADGQREFFCFEALTLVPFDRRLIDPDLLSPVELDWLDTYHRRVFDTIGPNLSGAEFDWLAAATRPLNSP